MIEMARIGIAAHHKERGLGAATGTLASDVQAACTSAADSGRRAGSGSRVFETISMKPAGNPRHTSPSERRLLS